MKATLRLSLLLIATVFAVPLCSAASAEEEKEAILALIGRMEAAWNRGDFRGYMEGFANPDVIFVSRGQFQKDWQGTLDQKGVKPFPIDVAPLPLESDDILAPDTAQLISRYQLDRPQDPQDGINTRLMKKRDGRWVIALNHVSSKEVPCDSATK